MQGKRKVFFLNLSQKRKKCVLFRFIYLQILQKIVYLLWGRLDCFGSEMKK